MRVRSLLKYAAFGLSATAIVAASFIVSGTSADKVSAGDIGVGMAIDVNPSTPGVQNVLFPAVGATFHVRVEVHVLDQGVYRGYQVKLTYDDAVLDAGPPGLPGAMPASWSSAPGATTGGNVLVFANSASCLPATGADALQDNGVASDHSEDDIGTNAIAMSCVDSQNASVPGALPHDWVDFYFRCATAGDILLRLDSATSPIPDAANVHSWANAFVYCTAPPDATPTGTPTPTDTPVPSSTPTSTPTPTDTPTNTPTNTATPTDTPTRTNTPVPPTSTATRTNTPVPPTATPTSLAGCFGDLNGDGKVTGRDVAIVARSLRSGRGAGDVDGDGDVDLVDLKLVIAAMHARAC